MPLSEHSSPHDVATLYSNHHSWLIVWLRKKLGNTFDAADLAQDTFVRVLGRRHEMNDLREPRAWLTAIAHGLVVDHVRRQDVERAYLEVIAHLPEPQMFAPEARLMLMETLLALDALLDGLNPRARSAFLMSRLEDMSYPDIAASLGVSLSSVEKYMATAIRHCLAFRRTHLQAA